MAVVTKNVITQIHESLYIFFYSRMADLNISSPDMSRVDFSSYSNTPGGKKLKSRLNELITTLGSTKLGGNMSSASPDDSLLLTNASQPDFSNIDF